MKTKLKNRDLYFDGESAWTDEAVESLLLKGIQSSEIMTMNKFTGFKQKKEITTLPPKKWNIPVEYFEIDLGSFFLSLAQKNGQAAIDRTKYELEVYKNHNATDVLYLMIYIMDTLNKHSVPFGVGRGSSVSSYLLFLIGVHLIDPIKYDLDIHEFLK